MGSEYNLRGGHMEVITNFDEIERICKGQVTGRYVRPKDSMLLQELARDIEKEKGYQRFLFDMTQAEIISGIMDSYEAATVPLDMDHTQVNQKIAVLYAKELPDQKYITTVATKKGYQVRSFYNMDGVVEWLRS